MTEIDSFCIFGVMDGAALSSHGGGKCFRIPGSDEESTRSLRQPCPAGQRPSPGPPWRSRVKVGVFRHRRGEPIDAFRVIEQGPGDCLRPPVQVIWTTSAAGARELSGNIEGRGKRATPEMGIFAGQLGTHTYYIARRAIHDAER